MVNKEVACSFSSHGSMWTVERNAELSSNVSIMTDWMPLSRDVSGLPGHREGVPARVVCLYVKKGSRW